VARAYTVDHLNNLLMNAASRLYESEFSVLIVDSIMAPFRVDYSGRGELCIFLLTLAERQQVLGRTLSRLLKISEQFNIAVFLTNQVMSDPGGGTFAGADTRKPIGGNILAHASTTRLYLRKGKAEQRICKIYDSPMLAEGEAVFQLAEGGIIDPND